MRPRQITHVPIMMVASGGGRGFPAAVAISKAGVAQAAIVLARRREDLGAPCGPTSWPVPRTDPGGKSRSFSNPGVTAANICVGQGAAKPPIPSFSTDGLGRRRRPDHSNTGRNLILAGGEPRAAPLYRLPFLEDHVDVVGGRRRPV